MYQYNRKSKMYYTLERKEEGQNQTNIRFGMEQKVEIITILGKPLF